MKNKYEQTAEEIIENLSIRRGFDSLFDVIDEDIESEINNEIIKILETNLKPKYSEKELLECILNLVNVLDTPIARRKINDDIANEARKIGRKIIADIS